MELSKPGSHAWGRKEGTSGQSSRSSPLTRTLFVGFPPHGGEARDHFISQLVGACILHREERLLALYGLALALRLYFLTELSENGKRTADGTNGVGVERYEFLSGQILAARGLIDVTELCDKCRDNGLFDIHKVQNELSNRYRTVVFRK